MTIKIYKIKKISDIFYNLLTKYSSSVVIDWSGADQFIKNKLEELNDSAIERKEKLKLIKKKFSEEEIINKINNLPIDNKDEWVDALKDKDDTKIWQLYLNLSREIGYEIRNQAREIVNFVEALSQEDEEEYVYNIDAEAENIKTKLLNKFSNLEKLINDAISRVFEWKNSNVSISPSISEDDFFTNEDLTSYAAEVFIDSNLSFTVFYDSGKIQIEDKLELGDEDFFTEENKDAASDYFSLIQELEKPGSSSRGKIITLYTSRPKKDREYYLNNKELPSGIFLTKSFNFAESFGEEYGQERDVWKVKINQRDVVLTYDGGGSDNQYQLIRTVIPQSMELVSAS